MIAYKEIVKDTIDTLTCLFEALDVLQLAIESGHMTTEAAAETLQDLKTSLKKLIDALALSIEVGETKAEDPKETLQ